MEFHENDLVAIQKVSVNSMIKYGEDKSGISCPCHWRRKKGIVTKIQGNWVHVYQQGNPSNKSVFFHGDLRYISSDAGEK